MRNGDGQTAGHPGIRKSGKTVETLGEVMIRIERPLVERARAGSAEMSGREQVGGTRKSFCRCWYQAKVKSVLLSVGVFHARPPDIQQLFRIKIVVFDPAHEKTALVRGANAQRVRRVILPDVFVAGKKLERIPSVFAQRP